MRLCYAADLISRCTTHLQAARVHAVGFPWARISQAEAVPGTRRHSLRRCPERYSVRVS